MSAPVGLLHTVPALAARFDADLERALPGTPRVHVVDADLLATAVVSGVTPAVRSAMRAHVAHLVARGAAAVLVTCSSIGEAAEEAAGAVDVPVVRVDAAMAREAVARASAPGARGRVAVLATLASTLGPTGRLVERTAAGADLGSGVVVDARVVAGAAEARAAGDEDRADALVAAAVGEAAQEADVVVLAQASMAGAAARAQVDVPVLTSPAGGVADLVAAARRGEG
ncbi:aspartate/glutamate racemase family protein [Cellulomonas marina]|uniref:aspartate/glutamate racemase family protein n=1 Tax=Cellulomonas marina TaxID=988821 RepID=UPI0015871A52|nr:aspartate/glutamate racemase family protein [Cellulomonas marina]